MNKVRRRSVFAAPMAKRNAAQACRPEARAALEGRGRGGPGGAMRRAPVRWKWDSSAFARVCPQGVGWEGSKTTNTKHQRNTENQAPMGWSSEGSAVADTGMLPKSKVR
jgi:hypothetical protein